MLPSVQRRCPAPDLVNEPDTLARRQVLAAEDGQLLRSSRSNNVARPEGDSSMTESAPSGPTPESEPAARPAEEDWELMPVDPEDFLEDIQEDPGYLVETGQAAAADGSVVPIIGGLPAAEGSAWDIGAAEEDRGAGLSDEQGGAAD
jgi:hypothetical protein